MIEIYLRLKRKVSSGENIDVIPSTISVIDKDERITFVNDIEGFDGELHQWLTINTRFESFIIRNRDELDRFFKVDDKVFECPELFIRNFLKILRDEKLKKSKPIIHYNQQHKIWYSPFEKSKIDLIERNMFKITKIVTKFFRERLNDETVFVVLEISNLESRTLIVNVETVIQYSLTVESKLRIMAEIDLELYGV